MLFLSFVFIFFVSLPFHYISFLSVHQFGKGGTQLEELERRIEDSQTVQNDVQEWVSLIRQYRNLESLDRETLLRLIDKIEIDEQRIVDGLKEREIRIY